MNTEYFRVYDCCEWQVGENFYDTIPDVVISIFPEDLVIETICSGKRGCLVIAPKQDKSLWLDALEYQEIANGLNGVVTTIHVISKKHVATICRNYM